jgi:uncharacterized membrane protein YvlD (DUF360 family)
MPDTKTQELGLLAKLVIATAIALLVVGSLWYGFTLRAIERGWSDLLERSEGPMRLRFMLQPTTAAILAVRDGLRDARSDSGPYLMTVLRDSQKRIGLLNEGLNATSRIIVIGLVMDVIYQALVLKTFYPDEALVAALLLGFIPYLIVRGLAARAARSQQANK